MATLIEWSHVDERINTYRNIYDCDSRSVALAYVAIENLLELMPEEIGESITDGPNDRGIDAIVITAEGKRRTVHLFQVKCCDKFENAIKTFPSGEVDKLLSFVADVLSKDERLKETCNPLLWAKVQEIWDAFSVGSPAFVIHLVGNMQGMISTELDRLKRGLEAYRTFDVKSHTLESISRALIENQSPVINRTLRLVDLQYFERSDGNIRGLIATVQASDLVDLIRNPEQPTEVLPGIFDDNVRIYLTRANRVNAMIYESALSESNAEFWYLNNGITMTCDSMSYLPGVRAPLVDLSNVQIVNGGQTSHTIFEAFKDDAERLRKVLILVRIYETKHREISLRIAESTNSQTPIRSRDLRANDQVQRKLASTFESLGYFYERKARQFKDEDRDRRIDAQVAGQAYVAYFLELPEVAGKDRGKIFGELYEIVYNEDEITADRLLASVQVFEIIERTKRRLQTLIRNGEDYDPKLLFLVDGAYHLLYAISVLCDLASIDPLDVPAARKKLFEGIDVVVAAVEHEKQRDIGYAHKRFFKSTRARKLIRQFASLKNAADKENRPE